eukprot:733573-Rhodomonas_salina.3
MRTHRLPDAPNKTLGSRPHSHHHTTTPAGTEHTPAPRRRSKTQPCKNKTLYSVAPGPATAHVSATKTYTRDTQHHTYLVVPARVDARARQWHTHRVDGAGGPDVPVRTRLPARNAEREPHTVTDENAELVLVERCLFFNIRQHTKREMVDTRPACVRGADVRAPHVALIHVTHM